MLALPGSNGKEAALSVNASFDPTESARMLRESLGLLEYFLTKVPASWERRRPENAVRGLPETTPDISFVLAHLLGYEVKLALPVLEAMLDGADGTAAVVNGHVSWFRPYVDEQAKRPPAAILDDLRKIRSRHVEVVERFTPEDFNDRRTPLWGVEDGRLESAGWVADKTTQHTVEHTNQVARVALFAPVGAE
jgi:hypothetical protein